MRIEGCIPQCKLISLLAYPYGYTNSMKKYDEEQLPSEEEFYNLLNDEHVNEWRYHQNGRYNSNITEFLTRQRKSKNPYF